MKVYTKQILFYINNTNMIAEGCMKTEKPPFTVMHSRAAFFVFAVCGRNTAIFNKVFTCSTDFCEHTVQKTAHDNLLP